MHWVGSTGQVAYLERCMNMVTSGPSTYSMKAVCFYKQCYQLLKELSNCP